MTDNYVVSVLAAVLITCIVFAGLLGVMISQGYKTLRDWAKGERGASVLVGVVVFVTTMIILAPSCLPPMR